MEIQLYIANKLCDLSSSDLAITLKRQFLNPEALNTKDAQKSYSITLPATPTNNEIFSHVNVEEVGDKFRIYPNARLYVGGVLILDGKFRLSEIRRDSYKGNLGVPKILSAQDVFGDTKMTDAGEWLIDILIGVKTISEYNQKDNSPVIFPLALYGLLPKSAKSNGSYTVKNLYDAYVTLGIDDFPPSVNCIEMLKKIFANSGYNLSGTALTDEKLTNLYMSYKNPNDYQLEWGVSDIALNGKWSFYNPDTMFYDFERRYEEGDNKQISINLFKTNRKELEVVSDKGDYVSTTRTGETSVIIPYSGLYKVEFNCSVNIGNRKVKNPTGLGIDKGTINQSPMEVHLVRNTDKQLSDVRFNNKFAYDNLEQKTNFTDAIFPQSQRVNFIDPKQDKSFLCGFAFGENKEEDYRNPHNGSYCNPMAISGGRSWSFNNEDGTTNRSYSAVYSPSYLLRNGNIANKFVVDLNGADTNTTRSNNNLASGVVNQVIWLEKNDSLDLLFTTKYHLSTISDGSYFNCISDYSVAFDLKITPFQHNLGWLRMSDDGSSNDIMSWNDKPSFNSEKTNLIKFLPSEVKVNDWIDHFCKAFNLILHSTGKNNFNLDIKDKGTVRNTSIIIDLDKRANVSQSSNQPLNLPYVYELGFTVDTSEEGYFKSITKFNEQGEPILTSGDNGGGIFETGSIDTTKQTQTSNFSYCWYKDIKYWRDDSILRLPVITDKEIWEHDYDTKEMLSKQYFDKGQRFWYKSGVKELHLGQGRTAQIALVSETYNGDRKQTLSYKNEPNTIMSNYFLLLTNRKYYTVVECYLSPEEYSNLDIALVRFNGDLYNIAEIDGYDPLGRRKCTLKLVRKL